MENKMMVMRKALRDVSRVAEEMTRGTMTGESVDRKTVDSWAMRLCEIISRDLAIPLRNCDVGTAEEQIKRWEKFCQEHHEYWKQGKSLTAIQRCNCPCHEGNGCNYFIWAQMPYEAQEGGEK